jgi:hypothetical protein
MPVVLLPQSSEGAEYSYGLEDVTASGTGAAVPRGVEAEFEYNGFHFNDTSTVDKYRVISIDGLDDADVRDSREENPAEDGETPYDSFYGGRTLAFTGRVEAYRLHKLRDMQQSIRTAFSDISQEKPLYFLTGDANWDHYINCKKSSKLQWGDEQKHQNQFFRDFVITVRASNPRFLRNIEKVYTENFITDYDTIATGLQPELYWPLDAEGLAEDQTANNRDGTAEGGISVGSFATGPFDVDDTGATTFDGTDDRITSASYSPYVNGGTITVFGYAYREDSAANHSLIGSNATNRFQLVLASGSQNILLDPDTSAGSGNLTWTAGWPGNDQWVHWIFQFNEVTNTAEFWINGVSIGTKTVTDPYNASVGNFKLGASGTTFLNPFNGKMRGVGILSRAITAPEIASLVAAQTGETRGSQYFEVVNDGNWTAQPTIRIHGGASAVSIMNEANGQTFALKDSVTIAEGDYYDINMEHKTIVDAGGGNKFADLDNSSDWLVLEPGTNLLIFDAALSGINGGVEVKFRDSWI